MSPATNNVKFLTYSSSRTNRQQVLSKDRYEFEPDSPNTMEDRQTTFTDSIRHSSAEHSPNPRSLHMKNSRSEGNAIYLSQGASPTSSPASPVWPTIHRSGSSPSILPLRFPNRRDRVPSPDIVSYYQEDIERPSPAHRGRTPAESMTHHGHHLVRRSDSKSPARQQLPYQDQYANPCSPTRSQGQGHGQDAYSMSSAHGHHRSRSPTKALDDVLERDEFDSPNPSVLSPFNLPMKPPRSRSPMKKMFGEHGWLGQSPDEVQEHKFRSPKSSITRKEDSSHRQKKLSIMGKLKNKLEEIVRIVRAS